MMLKKRSGPDQKDKSLSHLMADSTTDTMLPGAVLASQKTSTPQSTSFFSVPGLFIGFNSKSSSDSDSVRSPTSPLDYKIFSNLGNPLVRSPRSSSVIDSPRKSWDSDRVGLGLVDSLSEVSNLPGKVVGSFPDSRNIIFGSKMKIHIPSPKTCLDRTIIDASASSPKSLPKNYVISSQTFSVSPCFESGSSQHVLGTGRVQMDPGELGKIRSCSADIGRMLLPTKGFMNPNSNSGDFPIETKKSQLGSSLVVRDVDHGSSPGSLPLFLNSFHGVLGSLSTSDIETSEDYTRIITHGPNPKTTHIFGDCILESHPNELFGFATDKMRCDVGKGSSWLLKCSEDPLPSPDDFLSFCYFCKKKLVDGEDIYMYRGEKAFCSCKCREQEILVDEETDKLSIGSANSPRTSCDEEIFLAGMVVTA